MINDCKKYKNYDKRLLLTREKGSIGNENSFGFNQLVKNNFYISIIWLLTKQYFNLPYLQQNVAQLFSGIQQLLSVY